MTVPSPTSEALPVSARVAHLDPRILLRGISWATDLRILDETADRRRVRLAFSHGELELMSPGPLHAKDGKTLDRMIGIVCDVAEIDFKGFGSTTWHRNKAERGIEADECYYFAAKKITAAGKALRGGSNDSQDYPIPDLVIEVNMRRSALDRADIYARLRVPEVWNFEVGRMHILHLGDDRSYREAEDSRFIPITSADVAVWAEAFEQCDNERLWARDFRNWVRTQLANRG